MNSPNQPTAETARPNAAAHGFRCRTTKVSDGSMKTNEQHRTASSRSLDRPVRQFVENREGVHLCNVAEYTLCGDALEGDGIGLGDEFIPRSEKTQKRVVTCPRCTEIIEMCRGVKCRPNDQAQRPERENP